MPPLDGCHIETVTNGWTMNYPVDHRWIDDGYRIDGTSCGLVLITRSWVCARCDETAYLVGTYE